MSANYELRGNVAVITLDNPPVNGLGFDTRKGVTDGLDKALNDDAVKAIVITGAGKAFSGGADIREFNKPREKPDLPEVNDFQDAMKKPLVAAITGFALGGGLELALACHYRIASDHPKTVLALPEVQLGLIPGAGGTQRLPRLIGLQRALDMILTGRNIRAKKASQRGASGLRSSTSDVGPVC